MARPNIETVSPFRVYNRIIFGVLIALGAYFLWTPNNDDEAIIRAAVILVGSLLCLWGVTSVRNPLLAFRYASNAHRTVISLIEEWKPKPARLESEYEKSLHTFLKSRLPFVKITRQYGSARVKCDLATGTEVIIELKAGFRSTQKLQRLIGQVDLFRREWEKPIVVVLLGETEEDLLHDLHRSLRPYEKVFVVTKEVEAPDEDKD